MKPSLTALASLLFATACGPAWSQSAAPATPRAPAVASAAKTATTASLTDTLKQTSELHKWVPSATAPDLACPKGTVQERRTTDGGWETWCARGSVKHGPARAFDRAQRRETRTTWADGKLHGPASEIRLRPALSVIQSDLGYGMSTLRLTGLDELTQAAADLAGWLPAATPPKLACPESTTQHDEVSPGQWEAECRRIDGSAHGPRRSQHAGRETREILENGVRSGTSITIDARPVVTESTYEKGTLVKRLEWSDSLLATLEVARGGARALLRFHANGSPAQLTRFEGGVRHGEQRSWHPNGQLAEKAVYAAGKERSGAQTWDDQGRLVETRMFEDGTGTVENLRSGGEGTKTVCQYKAGKLHGTCRTTNKAGQLTDEMVYVDGGLQSRKQWWDDGAPRQTMTSDPKTGDYKVTAYAPGGRVEEVTEVQAGVSRKTTYDAKGAPIPPAPQSPQARTITTEEALRSLQTML